METLKKGSRGEQVKILQRHLDLLDDGIFGVLTEEAVKEFQKSHGLVADGIVGADTKVNVIPEGMSVIPAVRPAATRAPGSC